MYIYISQLSSCALFNFFFPRDMLVSRYQHSAATVAICLFKLRSPPDMRPQFMSFNGPKEVLPAKFLKNYFFDQFWTLNIADC